MAAENDAQIKATGAMITAGADELVASTKDAGNAKC
jgi:hypothetical protein